MKKKLHLMVLFVLVMAIVTLAGCTGASTSKGNDNVISEGAVVQFVNLEGGFYGLITHWGNKYEPINLSKEFQEDGLLVNVDARIRTDVANTHMWGTPIEIINISKIGAG